MVANMNHILLNSIIIIISSFVLYIISISFTNLNAVINRHFTLFLALFLLPTSIIQEDYTSFFVFLGIAIVNEIRNKKKSN